MDSRKPATTSVSIRTVDISVKGSISVLQLNLQVLLRRDASVAELMPRPTENPSGFYLDTHHAVV